MPVSMICWVSGGTFLSTYQYCVVRDFTCACSRCWPSIRLPSQSKTSGIAEALKPCLAVGAPQSFSDINRAYFATSPSRRCRLVVFLARCSSAICQVHFSGFGVIVGSGLVFLSVMSFLPSHHLGRTWHV